MGLSDIIDAILLNNPGAVSENLAAAGLIDEGRVLGPDELKSVLYDSAYQMSEEDSAQFLIAMLDVPIELQGEGGEEMLLLQSEQGNRLALQAELNQCVQSGRSTPAPGWFPEVSSDGMKIIGLLSGVFLLVLIIALIRKL